MIDAIQQALPDVVMRDGKVEQAFVKALSDPIPSRRIAGLPREFHTWYIPQEIGKALDDYLRVICDKDLHFFLLEDHPCDSSE